MTIEEQKKDIFKKLWEQYAELTPQALEISGLLKSQNEPVLNDHVAFRSVAFPGFGLKEVCAPFLNLGYEIKGDYNFEQKKLDAVHLESTDPQDPKIFVSQIKFKELSKDAQKILEKALYYVEPVGGVDLLLSGRFWEASHENYKKLYQESEYAAWFYAFGFCANHFTVSVNHLNKYSDLKTLNDFIESHGFSLNESGGKIKGSKKVCLEQSSTKASLKTLKFSDGEFEVPSCYYEFAKRYKTEEGNLYQGFVTDSADKIFESTN